MGCGSAGFRAFVGDCREDCEAIDRWGEPQGSHRRVDMSVLVLARAVRSKRLSQASGSSVSPGRGIGNGEDRAAAGNDDRAENDADRRHLAEGDEADEGGENEPEVVDRPPRARRVHNRHAFYTRPFDWRTAWERSFAEESLTTYSFTAKVAMHQ